MKKKTKLFILIIGITIICLLEFGARSLGITPGICFSIMNPVETIKLREIFKSDSLGIISYEQNSSELPKNVPINNLGFPSKYDFIKDEKIDNAHKVMMIGDSYTDGCCATPRDSSFLERLDFHEEFKAYNFGIGGTDIMQYRLILEHFTSIIDPDLIIVAIFLGNDIMPYKKLPRPYTPHVFAIENCGWLASEIYDGKEVKRFQSAEENL